MKTILVPLDFSDVTPRVVETAKSLARDLERRVALLHVISPPVVMTAYGMTEEQVPETLDREEEQARKEMQACRQRLEAEGIESSVLIVRGPPVDAIVLAAREQESDLLVMGSHGHGAFYEFIVGSTTRGVLKKFPGPVVLVPSKLPPAAE